MGERVEDDFRGTNSKVNQEVNKSITFCGCDDQVRWLLNLKKRAGLSNECINSLIIYLGIEGAIEILSISKFLHIPKLNEGNFLTVILKKLKPPDNLENFIREKEDGTFVVIEQARGNSLVKLIGAGSVTRINVLQNKIKFQQNEILDILQKKSLLYKAIKITSLLVPQKLSPDLLTKFIEKFGIEETMTMLECLDDLKIASEDWEKIASKVYKEFKDKRLSKTPVTIKAKTEKISKKGFLRKKH